MQTGLGGKTKPKGHEEEASVSERERQRQRQTETERVFGGGYSGSEMYTAQTKESETQNRDRVCLPLKKKERGEDWDSLSAF